MTAQKNVGWVRPEAVTHRNETADLPDGWMLAPLDQVCDVIMGQSPSSEYYNAEGNGLPFFQGKAEFGDLYPEAVKWCSAPGKIAQKDDVLISVRAPVGPTNLAPSECCIGRGLAAIRPRSGMPAKYILHYLRSIERDIDALGTGTTFKAISGKTLREIPVPIAPPDQQKYIVAEIEKQFSRLDEAVANLKRVKANLKRYKAAVLKAAGEGRLVETEAELARKKTPSPLAGEGGCEGESYETGAQLLQRILKTRRSQWKGKGKYKEPAVPDTTDLPELPEGWGWGTTDQLGHVQLGRQRSPKNRSKDYPVKYIRAANITERGLELEDVLDMEFSPDEQDRYRLRRGDLVLSEASGSPDQVGKPAVWQDQLPLCCFQNTVIRLRPAIEMSPYLLTCFQGYYINGVFARVASGVGINH